MWEDIKYIQKCLRFLGVWFCVVCFSSMHKTLTQKQTLFVLGGKVYFWLLDKLFILGLICKTKIKLKPRL